ncbi:type IV pilus assembly protein PilE [Variovorax sp. YR634]|nr:type IV pilin protein [Variovorax sp. YR634]SDX73472.1 type IV pilus assembly protein PilE [Variovorax sp. YR634]
MIVVAIVAILAAIAVPLYGEYVLRGRIPDATSNLSALSVKMEQGYQDSRSYNLAGSTTKCLIDTQTTALTSTNKSFDFSCVATADTFTIKASGKTATMPGFEFTIDQKGGKTSKGKTGWTAGTNCWITNKGGC